MPTLLDPMYVRLGRSPPGLLLPMNEQLCGGNIEVECSGTYAPRVANVSKRGILTVATRRRETQQGHQRSSMRYKDSQLYVVKNGSKDNAAKLHVKHPGCVIHVSEMANLGNQSVAALRSHYEQYGEVAHVWLSVVDVLPNATSSYKFQHPFGIALVIMLQKDDANTAIAAGEIQDVNGVDVRVRTFKPKTDHPRHQKAWFVSESDLQPCCERGSSDIESDTCSLGQASCASDSTAEPSTPNSLRKVSWNA